MLVPLELLLSLVYGCPQNLAPCKCTPPTVPGSRPILDCSALTEANQFSAISGLSARPPVHYDQIVIRRSQLDVIPMHAFGNSHANEYVIENNPMLETIENGAFGPNPNPKVLNIRSNPLLDSIPFDDIQTFSNVEILRLNDNRLTEVPDNAFDKMSDKLREIHLQGNVILDLGPFAFRGLPALELLDLSDNQLIEIPSAGLYFDVAPRLVDLSRNRIIGLDSEAFIDPGNGGKDGAYAMHINLSGNNIQNLQKQEYQSMFQKLDGLKAQTDPPPLIDAQELLGGTNPSALLARLFGQLGDPQNLGPERAQLLVSLLGLSPSTTTTTTTTTTTPAPAPASAGPVDFAGLAGGSADFASLISKVLALRAQQTGLEPPANLQALLAQAAGATSAATMAAITPTLAPFVVTNAPSNRQPLALPGPSPVLFQQAAVQPLVSSAPLVQEVPSTTAAPAPTSPPVVLSTTQSAPVDPLFARLTGASNQDALLAFLRDRFDLVPRGAGVNQIEPAVNKPEPPRSTPAPVVTARSEPPPPPPKPVVRATPKPSAAPAPAPATDSIKELKDRLLSAIRSNPEAAAVAAAAIRDAAKASSKAGAANISPAALEALSSLPNVPKGGNRVRRKRQVAAAQPPAQGAAAAAAPEKPKYSIDFTGNPLQCNCEAKWLFEAALKYSDQFSGMVCAANKVGLFSLPASHFSQC